MECGVLYHYTSLDAFVNIIKGKEFRLFDVTKSNDPLEGTYMIQALEESYHRLYRSEKIDENGYLLAHRALFQFKEKMYAHGRPKDFYATASFCVPNHDLLMLRSYADNGKGVAMGFPISMLENLPLILPNVQFDRVKYCNKSCVAEIADHFWLSGVKRYQYISSENEINEESLSPFVAEIQKYYQNGYFVKDVANKDEDEYRLLYRYDDLFSLHIPGIIDEVPQEIDFFSKNGDVKAYYKIPLGNSQEDSFYFSDIVGCPLCGASIGELQALLCRYGFFNCSVNKNSWVKMR